MSETRIQISLAGRRLAEAGLCHGTSGNISVREDDRVWITGTGVRLSEVVVDDVVSIDLQGTQLSGAIRPSSEAGLHAGLYRRTGAQAVVHVHSPAAVALSLIADELPALHYQQLPLGGSVPVIGFELFGSPELANAVADAIGEKRAVIMAHHGAVVIGDSLAQAVENAFLLDWACELYLKAAAAGRPKSLSADQLQSVRESIARNGYGLRHAAEVGK